MRELGRNPNRWAFPESALTITLKFSWKEKLIDYKCSYQTF